MKKYILGFAIGCALLTCFSSAAQELDNDEYDEIKGEIARSIRMIFASDISKGLQEFKGEQLLDEGNGTLIYTVESDNIKTHADSHFILVQPGSPMGLYIANYGDEPAILNSSLKAFIAIGDPWLNSEQKNPFTIEKDETLSKDGMLVYVMYGYGFKVGMYLLDQNEKKASMMIGPL